MPNISNKRLNDALDKQEAAIRRAFTDAIDNHKGSINLTALVEALDSGDIERAANLLSVRNLFALDAAITAAYTSGAQTIVDGAPRFAASFGFNGRHERAERWIRGNAAALVQNISDEQETIIKDVIERQVIAGQAPRVTALEIVGRMDRASGRRVGGVVGLNQHQAQTVSNVRDDLTNLNSRYFTRKLRDRRFDGLVRTAIADGKTLSQTDIDRITNRYADRALKSRGNMIARTESINALRAGRDEGVRQAIEQGAISNSTKVWDASGDSRTRPDHLAMEGQEVDIDEPFIAPDGSRLMYAGDSSLGAAADQVIQCRCIIDYRVDWLRG